MKQRVCKQIRFRDAWFQQSFVGIFLLSVNAAMFIWPDSVHTESLWMLYVMDVVLVFFVFSNVEVWQDSETKDVTIRKTMLGVIPFSRRVIRREQLSHLISKRAAALDHNRDKSQWSNFTAELVWHDSKTEPLIAVRSVLIMQRNQELSFSVKEAKQIASRLGIEFQDRTQKKSAAR